MPGEAGNCMKKGLRRVLSLALAVFTGTAGMAVVPGKPGRKKAFPSWNFRRHGTASMPS